jgi:serine acetyltransferase
MNSSVREGVQIGVDVLLGMAAAALEDVPAHQTWVGVPARPITRTVAALPSASPAAGADPVSTTRFGTS